MSYTKTNWQNTPSTQTPISAANLNHMEQGIFDAAQTADSAQSGVDGLDPRMDLVEQRLDNLIPQGTPTQGNAELIDIRVGANGVTYPDAGSAVRGQYTQLKSALSEVVQKKYSVTNYRTSNVFTRENGSASVSGTNVVVSSNNTYFTYNMEITEDTEIYMVNVPTNIYISICVLKGFTSHTGDTYSGTSAVRYRSSDSNLPTENNKLSVEQGDYIFITTTQVSPAEQYWYIYGAEWSKYDYSDKLESDLPKRCKVVYDDTVDGKETERLYIYLPSKNGYARVNFCHAIDETMNYNLWLIHPLYAVNNDLVSQYQITTTGEFECALHRTGESDFIGGTSHGDEIASEIYFFVDNLLVDADDLTTLTEFGELRVVEKSSLYSADDHELLVAYHEKEYIFTADGIKINQVVTWQKASYVVDSYLAMFPVKKDISPKIITNKEYQVRVFADDGYFNEMDTTKAISFSDNFNATFEIEKYEITGTNLQNVGKFFVTDNNGGAYNKQYFYCTSAGHVEVGDVWRSTTKYTFNV